MPDSSTLAADVRARLGSPPLVELPDAVLDAAIASGLREFSRLKPYYEDDTLEVLAGQADYELPDDVVSVDVVSATPSTLSALDPDSFVDGEGPSDYLTVSANLRWLRLYRQTLADRDEVWVAIEVVSPSATTPTPQPTLGRVFPTPPLDATLAVRYAYMWDVTDISLRDYDPLLKLCMGEALSSMAFRRARRVTAMPTGVGTLRFDDGSNLSAWGEKLIKEARRALGAGATMLTQG